MNFISSCSTRYLTRSLRSIVRYRVDHSKIKFLSTCGHVISSISALDAFMSLRYLLKFEDGWKIKFRKLYEKTYTGLCRSLFGIGKVNEALFATEQGRAQALFDNLFIQYDLTTSLSPGCLN